jgi:hypothetical protein
MEQIKKKTPVDFLMEDFESLHDLYQKTQFPKISFDYSPDQYLKQKRRQVFDILCDRLGKDKSEQYEELIKSFSFNPKTVQNQKLIELQSAVIKGTEISADVLLCRNIWKICQKYNIETSDQLAEGLRITKISNMQLIPYFKKFAAQFVVYKKDQYIQFVHDNISFWRATKGETLPVTLPAYIWAEALEFSKERIGYTFTDDFWETIKLSYKY